MKRYILLLASSSLLLSACSNQPASYSGEYSSYNCTQISMEHSSLLDQIAQASSQQSTNQVYQLAMAAFALSNGNSFNAKPDTSAVDNLNAQLNELREEAIRKQCGW